MTVYQGSRYEGKPVFTLRSDRGWRPTVLRVPPTTPPRFALRILADNENFMTLAALLFGDSELWWVIADANPGVLYPDDIAPGTVIRLPQ